MDFPQYNLSSGSIWGLYFPSSVRPKKGLTYPWGVVAPGRKGGWRTACSVSDMGRVK
jgi:hypothetical protein